MTALAGLPAYLECAHLMGLGRLISRNVHARSGDQGWTDEQMVMSLVLLNLAGGEVAESHWEKLFRKVNGELKDTGQQYAEVCFAPDWAADKKQGPEYRYLAIREPIEQPVLPGMEDQLSLPFQTMDWGAVRYKVTGMVTNRGISPGRVLDHSRSVIVRLVGEHPSNEILLDVRRRMLALCRSG